MVALADEGEPVVGAHRHEPAGTVSGVGHYRRLARTGVANCLVHRSPDVERFDSFHLEVDAGQLGTGHVGRVGPACVLHAAMGFEEAGFAQDVTPAAFTAFTFFA